MESKYYPGYGATTKEVTTYNLRYYEGGKCETPIDVCNGCHCTMKKAVETAETLAHLHNKRLHIAKVVRIVTEELVWTMANKSSVVPVIEQLRLFLEALIMLQPIGTFHAFTDAFNKACGIDCFDVRIWVSYGQTMYQSDNEKEALLRFCKDVHNFVPTV